MYRIHYKNTLKIFSIITKILSITQYNIIKYPITHSSFRICKTNTFFK